MNPENKEAVGVLFPEKESGEEKVMLELEKFVENHPVEFGAKDEKELIQDFEELSKRGLRGVLHLIHRGSVTGDMVTASLPSKWRETEGFYQRLHILKTRTKISPEKIRPGDEVVYIDQDGEVSQENQEKLDGLFQDRVGIILGGGPGSPKETIYKPVLGMVERALKTKTPLGGICLGHQLFGELMLAWKRGEEGTAGGYQEGLTSVERVTPEGLKHAVFGRLGPEFTTVSFNSYHVVVPNPERDIQPFGKVITRSKATHYPSSLSWDAEREGQLLSTQRHPEIGMLGRAGEILLEDATLDFPSGNKLIIPAGSHPHMLTLGKVIAGGFNELSEKYGVTEEDARDLFHQDRLSTHLGVDFYGPLLKYLANFRLKQ